jgi:poly-beta-hydroxyalkanoate depolymerase
VLPEHPERDIVCLGLSSGKRYHNFLNSQTFYALISKICRKESKESAYWLKLVQVNKQGAKKRESLIDEATQLMNIFNSIVEKSR